MEILHIHAKKIKNIDDLYILIESQIKNSTPLYSRNLDALADVISELGLQKVILHDNLSLKRTLEKDYKESSNEMSLYYRLLDIFIDLPGVDIELEN